MGWKLEVGAGLVVVAIAVHAVHDPRALHIEYDMNGSAGLPQLYGAAQAGTARFMASGITLLDGA